MMNLVVLITIMAVASAQELTFPPELRSEGGELNIEISIEKATVTIPNSDITMTTRLFNGQYPGSTLRIKPGDTINLNYTNNLIEQGRPFENNLLSAPDESNLHFHGMHVSGELPSDDSFYTVYPGESYLYSTFVPEDHFPGAHWLHTHRHGSTALQLGGGAIAAIIVEDEEGSLPVQVQNAREVLFLAHQLNLRTLMQFAQIMGDDLMSVSDMGSYITVNGQLNPVITVDAGEWIRLRIIYAGWHGSANLGLEIPNCDTMLLSKDGIYIQDYPRSISIADVETGGRADVMVRCSQQSTNYPVNGIYGQMATITTTSTQVDSADLQPYSWTYPEYLQDLRNVPATDGCSCRTALGDDGGNTVNSKKFDPTVYSNTMPLGAVVERELLAGSHPYHQHVHSFQIIDGFEDESGYYKVGDWHDVIQGNGYIRWRPTVFHGKVMAHCHILEHEDKGMMATEYIHAADDPDQSCSCDVESIPFTKAPTSAPTFDCGDPRSVRCMCPADLCFPRGGGGDFADGIVLKVERLGRCRSTCSTGLRARTLTILGWKCGSC